MPFWGRWLPRFTVLLAFFAVAVVFQHLGDAYRADLSGYPDEPGHFVTGVMVSNYLSTPPPAPMVPFAKEFYIHYPKVAIGHWPPVFYLLEGFWFLLFHPSRESVLWLIALISALLSATVYGVVRREYGAWAGVAAGFLLQCVPIVWTQTGQVMTDLLVGLFGFWAALAFASFLQKGRRLSLYGFAILAILAIFTKNNGMYLSLTPVLALASTKRLRLLLSPWLWLSAALVGVPTAAWFAFSRKFVISTWGEAPSLSFFRRALGTNAVFLISIFGIAFSVLICVGLFRKVVQPLLLHAIVDPLWAVLASLAASVYLFQSVMWAGLEPRFIVPAVPALIPFLFAGVEWLARLAAPLRGSMRVRALALLACATVLFACQTFAVPRKPYRGFSEVADVILSRPESGGAAILVSSAYDGEGLLISECVMRQPHPTAFVLRASKVLSRSDWLGRFYEARFPSANEVMRYLDDIPVDFLVIDNVAGFSPLLHQRQLMEMVEERPDRWRLMGTFPQHYPASNAASHILVYRRSGTPGNPEKKVRLEMGQILRRIL